MFTSRTKASVTWIALLVPLCSAGLFGLPGTYADDWATEGGNNSRTFSTSDALPDQMTLLWSETAPAPPRLAWTSAEGRTMEGIPISHRVRFDDAFRPIVAGGRLYFGSTVDHALHCRDLQTGAVKWTCFTGGPIRLSPTVHAGKVYFGSDDGRVYCADAETGQIVWQRRVSPREEWLLARGEMISKWPVRTGVLIHDGVAYAGAGIFPHEDIYLLGLDPETGRIVWREDNLSAQDAGRNDLSPQGYLLAQENLLVVPSGGSLPAVFDLNTKRLLHKRVHSWRGAAGVVGGTQALLEDGQIFTVGEHHVLGMNQKTGDIGHGWFDGRLLATQDDAAYILTGDRLAKLDRAAYLVASRNRREVDTQIFTLNRSLRGKTEKQAAEIKAEMQTLQDKRSELEKTGVVWSVPMTDDKALMVCGNFVIVGGAERVAAYSKADGREVFSAKVDGHVRGLAVGNGHLVASTDTGVMAVFGTGTATDRTPAETQKLATVDTKQQAQAAEILKHSGVRAGFALVAGLTDAGLITELARSSELKIYAVDPSAEKVAAARKRLADADLYGHRVVVHQQELSELPYSNYFADLVLSEAAWAQGDGQWPVALEQVERHLRPLGGVLLVGQTQPENASGIENLKRTASTSKLGDQLRPREQDGWLLLTRVELPGAGNWSHQYGNPGNTAISNDRRIQGDLGVLWYGDPGPGEMVNRHEGAVGPLSVNGKLFVQGETTIMAYDAYNGRHLWTHENPEAIRTGVFQNQNPGNLAAGDDALFHFLGDKCLQVDMETGKVVATHSLPMAKDNGQYEWGYVAIHDGILFGTATMRPQLASQLRRRGRVTADSTDGLFAIDIKTGKHLWHYAGQSISHHTIAIGPERIFFIDSTLTSEQREAVLHQDKTNLANLTGEERELAEKRLKAADVRRTVALNSRTGEKLWEQAVDVTDCSDIGIGGGKLTMMYVNDTLVLCGANANGHYWKQFVDGEFKHRRMVALSAYDGFKMWAKDANYKGRPIVIGNKVIAEPWMFDLKSGEQLTRKHPITGVETPWSVMRTGHHCGLFTGSDSGMLLFRSGDTGFMDLNADEGIRHFAGHRLGCWINAIAANGLVMIPEASAGCVCQFSIASTIVLEPRETRRPWTIYSAIGTGTPVQHLAVNLGAPGDRKDELGTIWFSYPRRNAYRQTSLDVQLPLQPKFADGGEFDSIAEERVAGKNADVPWLYTSWANGLQQLTLPLLGADDAPATYTIRLHFADGQAERQTPLSVSVKLNGQPAVTGLALPVMTDDRVQPVLHEVRGVSVEKEVVIELEATNGAPVLSAVEAIRE